MREAVRSSGYGRGSGYANRYGTRHQVQLSDLLKPNKRTLIIMANQLITAAILALIIIIAANIKSPYISKVMDGVRWVVEDNYDFQAKYNSIAKTIKDEINKFNGIPASKSDTPNNGEAVYTGASVMIMPVNGTITSNFGEREKPSEAGVNELHTGLDIAGDEGTPIKAALDGIVSKLEENNTLGRAVIIKHANGIETLYGHCSEILVTENDTVRQGDYIAKIGHTGNATAPHIHFEVLINGKPVDPLSVIGGIYEQK